MALFYRWGKVQGLSDLLLDSVQDKQDPTPNLISNFKLAAIMDRNAGTVNLTLLLPLSEI
jgi:hypothetical protein